MGVYIHDMIIVSLDRDGLQLKEGLSKSFPLVEHVVAGMVYGMCI